MCGFARGRERERTQDREKEREREKEISRKEISILERGLERERA